MFTGGGTGGHVYPGIEVYRAFKKLAGRPVRVIWIGSKNGLERGMLESEGVPFIGIPAGKLRRYLSFSNLVDVFRVIAGIMAAYVTMKRYRPKVLFSKGGYVSVPPVIGAKLAGIPVITHESDFDPGLATRINAKFSTIIAVSYEETGEFFQEALRPKIRVTGNPVRSEVLRGDAERGRSVLGFERKKPIILVIGGSQGARELNYLVWSSLSKLLEEWNIVHQTGKDVGGSPSGEGYRRYEYIFAQYGDILAAADLVLCRAGATTLWELAAAKKPSILVPLGTESSRGDQIRNAQFFEKIGASRVLSHGIKNGERLVELADELRSGPGVLSEMGGKAGSVFKPHAASEIAGELLRLGFGEEKRC